MVCGLTELYYEEIEIIFMDKNVGDCLKGIDFRVESNFG